MARKFNTRQFIDAMKKNGYRKAHGSWIQFKESNPKNGVYAACAGGQAFLNLGVNPLKVRENVWYTLPYGFTVRFTLPNDETSKSVTEIATNLENTSWYLDPKEFEIPDDFFQD